MQPIGLLNGHEHNISLMKLNPVTKLLATCSDFDYSIKVWSSSSSQECLDLNINPEKIHFEITCSTNDWINLAT